MPGKEDSQMSWWDGLSLEWDNNPSVRERIRAGQRLLLPHPIMNETDGQVDRSVHNARYNKVVLIPALQRWGQHEDLATPSVDYLYVEVDKLYKSSMRNDMTVKEIHNEAWALRKLMGLVKAQVSKIKPPTEPRLQVQ